MMLLRRLALSAVVLAMLGGCSFFGTKTVDYKTTQARSQPLEVPPELTAPTMNDRYAIPDPKSQTTYSTYNKGVGAQAASANTGPDVLPKFLGVRLERYGDERWLIVKGEPDKVWGAVRKFWIDAGYPLIRESPEVGIMETDWYEDRAKIPQDIVRRTIGRVLEGIYSTPRRDKFRTRLEKGTEPGTTEVFVSNRAMEEVYTNETQDRTVWQPRGSDHELEAEMLSRIMVALGADEAKIAAANAKAVAGTRGAAAAAASAAPAQVLNAVLENSGAGPLVINDGFDRAWRRVGLALDRVGFTVEDRDRSKGIFFVRYIDPEADLSATDKRSFVQKLEFWRSAPKAAKPQYRIKVSDAGSNMAQVEVLDVNGAAEKGSTGRKILGLLFEQLK